MRCKPSYMGFSCRQPFVAEGNQADPSTCYDQEKLKKLNSSPQSWNLSSKWLTQVCCWFGVAPCHCCCPSFPPMKESTSTRLMYFIMFVFTMTLALGALISDIPAALAQEWQWFNNACQKHLAAGSDCHGLFGRYEAVYKMCAGQLSLHLLLIPSTIFVNHSGSCLAGVHNGFWFWKWIWIVGINFVLFIFAPGGAFDVLGLVMRYIGLVGGGLFILLHAVFYSQFAVDFNAHLLKKSKKWVKWTVLLWSLTIVIVLFCVALLYVLFQFYAVCPENNIMLYGNVIGSTVVMLVTLVLAIKNKSKNGDVLQGAIIVSYILFQTWSSLHSRPSHEKVHATIDTKTTKTDIGYLDLGSDDVATDNSSECKIQLASYASIDMATLLERCGLAYYLFIALYKSVSHTTEQAEAVMKFRGPKCADKSMMYPVARVSQGGDDQPTVIIESEPHDQKRLCFTCGPQFHHTGQRITYDEQESTVYNYGFLHIQFAASILFVMMTLTHWFHPSANLELSEWTPNLQAVWIEYIAAWTLIDASRLFAVVYMLTLVIPRFVFRQPIKTDKACGLDKPRIMSQGSR